MKNLAALFTVSLLAAALLIPDTEAQTLAPAGVALPRQKICSLVVPDGQPGGGCAVTVTAKKTVEHCEGGATPIVTVSVSIQCDNEVCSKYRDQNNCGDDHGSFSFACDSTTLTIQSNQAWSDLMGPNGTCDSLTVTGSH